MKRLLVILFLAGSLLPAAQRYGYPVIYEKVTQGEQYVHNYYIPPAPSSTPWAPAWAPDGKSIAVSMQGSLWRVDIATGAATELAYGKTYDSSPAWSPDGKWIVYTADENAKTVGLRVLNVATGETRLLVHEEHAYFDPVFSPDGKYLAYVSTKPSGFLNLYARPIRDGQWVGPEIALTRDHRFPRDRVYFGEWDMATQPVWTPDGKEIVFVCNRNVPLGSGNIMKMPFEPDGIGKATVVLEEQSLYRTRPHVSPDGKRILYSSTATAADQFNNLYVIPVTGGHPYKLTFSEFDNFHPRWSPDGEWIAYVSNEGGLPQLWLLETWGGARRKIAITKRVWKRPMGTLRVSVADASTGLRLPARIHGLAPDGKFYPPPDVYSRLGRSAMHLFHTSGQFTLEVPPGPMTLTAVHGFEYEPASAGITVAAGATQQVKLRMKRGANWAARGWRTGSTHVHMNYAGNLHNTPANLEFMASAEGLDYVMNLVANKDNRILDHQFFGKDTARVHFAEEYRPPLYGHVFMIGLKDHLINPFTTGYEGTAIDSVYPSNTDMLRKARAQGAYTGYVHAFYGDADPLDTGLGIGKAFPVDVAFGLIDALEWSGASRSSLHVWHQALNNDFKVAPVGGEDSISNLHRIKLIGSVRTFAYTGAATGMRAWMEAMRQGLTFFSTGPMIEMKINGKLPGRSMRLPKGGGTIVIETMVHSVAPLDKVVIHRNGKVFETLPAKNGVFRKTVKVEESGWYSLYAEGQPYPWLDALFPQAATNAIRVYVGDQPIRSVESARYFARWIDKLKPQFEAWPWWRTPREKEYVLRQF
ncbi:MAG: CehA/McbA family metallohydrolase, partial [Bryobacteraceae bacterium]